MDKHNRRAAVVGVATAKMEKSMPMTMRDVAHRLIREAVEDAGITCYVILTNPDGESCTTEDIPRLFTFE